MSESIPPVPPELEGLFAAERARPDEPSTRRERVARRLESSVAAIAIGAAAGTAVGAAAAGAKGTAGGAAASFVRRAFAHVVRTKTTVAIVAASVAGGGVGGTIGYRAGQHASEVRHVQQAPAPQVPPPVVVPSADVRPTLPDAAPSAPPAPASPPVVRPPTSALSQEERDAKLAEELALVQMARTALMRGDAAGAFEAAERHRKMFSGGRLAEERESVAIQALAKLGRTDDARTRAAAFERKYPNSVALPIVRAAAGGAP